MRYFYWLICGLFLAATALALVFTVRSSAVPTVRSLETRIAELNQKFNQILIFLSFALVFLATLKDSTLLRSVGPWWVAPLFFVLVGILPVKEFFAGCARGYVFVQWLKVWRLWATVVLISAGSVLFLRGLLRGVGANARPASQQIAAHHIETLASDDVASGRTFYQRSFLFQL